MSDHVSMQNEELSRTVVTFVWGNPRKPWPSAHPEAIRRLFDDQAEPVLTQIDALFAEANRIRPTDDLAVYGARIKEHLLHSHPELTDEAREAIAARLTYSWR